MFQIFLFISFPRIPIWPKFFISIHLSLFLFRLRFRWFFFVLVPFQYDLHELTMNEQQQMNPNEFRNQCRFLLQDSYSKIFFNHHHHRFHQIFDILGFFSYLQFSNINRRWMSTMRILERICNDDCNYDDDDDGDNQEFFFERSHFHWYLNIKKKKKQLNQQTTTIKKTNQITFTWCSCIKIIKKKNNHTTTTTTKSMNVSECVYFHYIKNKRKKEKIIKIDNHKNSNSWQM